MSDLFQANAQSGKAKRHVGVYVLLCLSFFHNPFLTTLNSATVPSLRHIASYRATIASTELLKFKSPEKPGVLINALCDLASAFSMCEAPTQLCRRDSYVAPVFRQTEFFASNLWFRPPPSA